jgi:dUTP pyrophosphatase
MEELQFIRLSEKVTLPTRAHDGDAGPTCTRPRVHASAPASDQRGTGLVRDPAGLAVSSCPARVAIKHGVSLVNSPGLIDSGYRGEVRCC